MYLLTATADRSKLDIDNLNWVVTENTSGRSVDYEIIDDQVSDLFGYSEARALYMTTRIQYSDLGIERV